MESNGEQRPMVGSDEFYEYVRTHPPGMVMLDDKTVWIGVNHLADAFRIAQKLQLLVTGLEGFWCEGGWIVPDLEAIVVGAEAQVGEWQDIVDRNTEVYISCAEKLKETKSSFFEVMVLSRAEMDMRNSE